VSEIANEDVDIDRAVWDVTPPQGLQIFSLVPLPAEIADGCSVSRDENMATAGRTLPRSRDARLGVTPPPAHVRLRKPALEQRQVLLEIEGYEIDVAGPSQQEATSVAAQELRK
jgi:hypothetical protein